MRPFITSIIFSILLLFSITSCLVLVGPDSGKHKGWYKNTNNPHNPNSTNPGHGNGKSH